MKIIKNRKGILLALSVFVITVALVVKSKLWHGLVVTYLLLIGFFYPSYFYKQAFNKAPIEDQNRWLAIQETLSAVEVGTDTQTINELVGSPDKIRRLGQLDSKEAVVYVYFLNEDYKSFYKKIYFLGDEYRAALDSSQIFTNSYPFSRVVWLDTNERYKMCEDLTKNQLSPGDNLEKIKNLLGGEPLRKESIERGTLLYPMFRTGDDEIQRVRPLFQTKELWLEIVLDDNKKVKRASCFDFNMRE